MENIFTKLLKHSGILGAKALFNLKPGHGVAKAKVKVHLSGNSRYDRLEQIHADERKSRLLRLVTELMSQMLRLMPLLKKEVEEGMVQIKLGVP